MASASSRVKKTAVLPGLLNNAGELRMLLHQRQILRLIRKNGLITELQRQLLIMILNGFELFQHATHLFPRRLPGIACSMPLWQRNDRNPVYHIAAIQAVVAWTLCRFKRLARSDPGLNRLAPFRTLQAISRFT
jgi:hypothetical protein